MTTHSPEPKPTALRIALLWLVLGLMAVVIIVFLSGCGLFDSAHHATPFGGGNGTNGTYATYGTPVLRPEPPAMPDDANAACYASPDVRTLAIVHPRSTNHWPRPIELKYFGARPGPYTLESSTDLKTWTPVTTFNNPLGGTMEYPAGFATNDRQFYRMLGP